MDMPQPLGIQGFVSLLAVLIEEKIVDIQSRKSYALQTRQGRTTCLAYWFEKARVHGSIMLSVSQNTITR